MNLDLAKDRLVSHAFTNYATAAYQGRFAAFNVLSQFEHPSFVESEVLKTQQHLSKVHTWTSQLFEDECLFSASWTTPETFEAQAAVTMLEQLKPELYPLAAELVRVLSLPDLPQHDDVVFLLAMHARHAYSRDTYIRGFIQYAERFSLPEMARRYGQFIPECEFETRRNQELINLLRAAKKDISLLPELFFPMLFQTTVALPAIFRTHIHDINQLLSQFKGGLSWTVAEFTKAEADLWLTAGLGPAQAGYFRAFGMGPEEAGKWREIGIFDAALAVDWKKGGFTPETAKPWNEAKIPSPLAFVWQQSGFDPDEARELLAKGTLEPPPRDSVPRKKAETARTAPAKRPPKMSFPKRG